MCSGGPVASTSEYEAGDKNHFMNENAVLLLVSCHCLKHNEVI